jgi:hypothetical protein
MVGVRITGMEQVVKALQSAQEEVIRAAEAGLKKAAQHLLARAKALAPEDQRHLVRNIAATNRVERTQTSLRTEVVSKATADAAGGELYSERVHENMQYEGPNVGGSRTQGRGAVTLAKGVSRVEPSDGTAGGKYLERPLRNRTDQYRDIILAAVREVLGE